MAHYLVRATPDPARSTRCGGGEEVDYCRPPLAAERAAVLDRHFSRIEVERVEPGEGWQRVAALPSLWGDTARASTSCGPRPARKRSP